MRAIAAKNVTAIPSSRVNIREYGRVVSVWGAPFNPKTADEEKWRMVRWTGHLNSVALSDVDMGWLAN